MKKKNIKLKTKPTIEAIVKNISIIGVIALTMLILSAPYWLEEIYYKALLGSILLSIAAPAYGVIVYEWQEFCKK